MGNGQSDGALAIQFKCSHAIELNCQVETFGAMAKTEKIAFILEQVCYLLSIFCIALVLL